MGQVEVSGKGLYYLFWAVSLVVLVPMVGYFALPSSGVVNVAVAVLLGALTVASVIGVWRRRTGREPTYLGRGSEAYDIAWDPVAYPEQAARQRWEAAVRRLPGGDDEGDED